MVVSTLFGSIKIFPSLAMSGIHVRHTCKACFVHISDLEPLKGYLTLDAALLAANALVGSRLDYCNSLFRSLTSLDLRTPGVFKTVLLELWHTTKYSHTTPVRMSLGWLLIKHCSVFKTAILV